MGLHETLAQQEYVARQNRRRRLVAVCRILLLVLLLALWELGARLGLINDFIFSSPSRTALCFISMARDGSIFLHPDSKWFTPLLTIPLSSPLCSLA